MARIVPASGRDRERVRVRPAPAAEVHERLASPVAGQLGLGSVGVEDAQTGDMLGIRRRLEQQDPVGEHARVRGADGADPGFGQLERERLALDDQVVVAEGLPLLEVHTGAVYVPSRRHGSAPDRTLPPARAARARHAAVTRTADRPHRRAVPGPVPDGQRPPARVRRGLLRQRGAGDRRHQSSGRSEVPRRTPSGTTRTPSTRSSSR